MVEADPSVAFTVVHEDDDVLVVDKPAGLVVHPGAGNVTGTLVHGLVARYPEIAAVGEPDRPGIVHRLDRDTSGLLVVARTEAARGAWWRRWPRAHVERVVPGPRARLRPSPTPAWSTPRSGARPGSPTRMAVSASGARRPAPATRCSSAGPTPGARCCAAGSRPAAPTRSGCTSPPSATPSSATTPTTAASRRPVEVPRLFLHATRLAFDHPITGEHLAFDSPLPADLASVLDSLD